MECPACHARNIDGARFCATCGALLPAAPPEAADPLLGSVIGGRYRVTGVLGEGGMGRVYAGEQQMGTSVRKVAIKVLLAQYAKDPAVVARFMRECGTVSELEHPNTIKVYDFGPTPDDDLYIAMELLTGSSLEKALESGALPAERVDHILGQVCGSLAEAHEKGIVHRDLKPANIYLTKRAGEADYVKVLDFGIAKRDDKSAKNEAKLTQQGTVLGTPPYMSPEQFRGHELDARSDVYSLGVMAYEMLTGRLPFDADTPWAWATQHMTAQPFPFETVPIGSAIPAKMKAAVMRALSKDKNQRPQSVKEFYEDFTCGGRASSATGPRTSFTPGPAAPIAGMATGPLRTSQYPSHPPPPSGVSDGSGVMPIPSAPITMGAASQPVLNPSSPAMAVPADAYPGAPQVPAPPPPAAKKGRAGVAIGGVALVAIAGVVGGLIFLKSGSKPSGSERTDASAHAAPSATADAGGRSSEDDGGAGDGGATHVASHPILDPHAEQACRHAESAAAHDNLPEARRFFATCEGPGKAAAHAAIEQAELRVHRPPPPPPCRGRRCPR